jgi:anti-sigma factor RsiW
MTRQHPEDDAPEAAREWVRLVAYVQEQMSASERADFERELRADPELRARQRELAADHRRLARLLPAADWTDADLEARILRAWEQDQAGAAPAPVHVAPARSPWWWAGAVAAAALLLVGVAVWRAPGGWTLPPPTLHSAGLRGDEAAAPALSRTEVEQLDRELVRGLHRALVKAAGGRRLNLKSWSLRRDYHALAGTAFRLEIALYQAGQGDPVQTWTELFAEGRGFRETSGDFTARVAGDVVTLVARSTAQ